MDFNKLLEQAKVFQEQLQAQQAKFAELTIVGEAAAGLVKITINGRHDCEKVELDDSVLEGLSSEDAEKRAQTKAMLQDLIAASINDASRKIEAETQTQMQSVAGGMDMPAGFPFPGK